MISNDNFNFIDDLVNRYPTLAPCRDDVERAVKVILDMYSAGGKLLLCGNGGSAADCEHIAGELLKGFISKREPTSEELAALSFAFGSTDIAKRFQRAVPAIPLPSVSGVFTAFSNDVDPELVFAQLVYALGKKSDALLCLSTSGNSKNVVAAAKAARAMGMVCIAMTGEGGGDLAEIADVVIKAPESETYKVQEYHLPIYHAICAEVERILF